MIKDQPVRGCLWPMWPHSARPNHEYCGHKRKPESSYCEEHYAKSIRNQDEETRRFVPRRLAA